MKLNLIVKFRIALFTLFLGNISFLLWGLGVEFIYNIRGIGVVILFVTYGSIIFFIVSILLFGFVLLRVSEAIESDRLNDLSVLLFLTVGFILVFPLVPFFGYFLTVWAFISMYLVIGGLIYLIGREFYESKLRFLGLLVVILSFFAVNKIALIVIIIVVLVVFSLSGKYESYLLVNRENTIRFVEDILNICRELGFIDMREYGKKFSIPETLLVKTINKIAGEKNCRVTKVVDKILCEC